MKKKKLLCSMAAFLITLGICGCTWSRQGKEGKGSQAEAEDVQQQAETQTLVIALPFPDIRDRDLRMVEEKISEITREKAGINIELIPTGNFSKIDAMLAGNEQLDILWVERDMFYRYYIDKRLLPLDGLLEKYGREIQENVGMDTIHLCRMNGILYSLPNNRDYATGVDAYALRKDILDKYHINPDEIRTEADLEDVFETVKENEPDMTVVSTGGYTMLSNQYFTDLTGNKARIGVHMNYGTEEKLSNLYETEEYMNEVKRIRRWYLKGYLEQDYSTDTRELFGKIRRNELFAYTTKGKPGLLKQEEVKAGQDMVIIQFGKDAYCYNTVASYMYTITANTVSQTKAMELLNLLYSDPDINNLLCYGVEGVHYKRLPDGHITYADEKQFNPFMGYAWSKPNQFITHIWEGNKLTLWEDVKAFNENALRPCDMGFVFDISPVVTQYYNVEKVYDKYKRMIEDGYVNPEKGIMQMNNEMRDAGIDTVLNEKKRQYEMWKKRDNKNKP